MSRALQVLRAELTATHHQGRIERMLELGRQAQRDRNSLALIDALADGDVFERRLSLLALHTLRDGKRLLRFTEDPSASLRALAFTMAPRICDDGQALEALKIAYTLRRERPLLRHLAVRHRRAVVDRYLDWLAERPGLHDFADIVPWASPAGVRRHLGRALARPSAIFWDRLARSAPAALGSILCERLRDVPGEPDAVTRQLIERHTDAIVAGAPDAGLELLDLLFARRIFSKLALVTDLGGPRPAATLALIERHDLRPYHGTFRRSAAALSPDELARVVRRNPHLLGPAAPLRALLSREQLQAVLSAWCDVLANNATWGFDLLDRLTDPELRERAYQRWSVAARNPDGIIPIATVTQLPNDLREREGRRHLFDVVALGTRPAERMPYARFLPWDEATIFIKDFLGFPEGYVRGWALETLLAIPALRPDEPALADKALALVTARKNEQDPVRGAMLHALVAWPRAVWRKEHVPTIHRILRDALDAGDLSHTTAVAAESLLVRTFRLDPAAGATWLGTFVKERGNLYDVRLGAHLGDDDVRLAAPHLLQVARTWAKQQRHHQMIALADSLGDRLTLIPGLVDLLVDHASTTAWGSSALTIQLLLLRFDRARYESTLPTALRHWYDRGWFSEILALAGHRERPGKRQPPLHPEIAAALEKLARGAGRNEHVVQAVTLLRVRAAQHFDRILPSLIASDPSYVCLPVVYWHLHARRQDLLDGFLGENTIKGRFAPTAARWILPFRSGFHRWTPAQNTTFSAALSAIVDDHERDTPTIWRCLAVLAAMDSAPMDRLAAAARDDRPAVQDKAIRVMARCDQGQCVPTLLGCLDDERARIAIYGLRRALSDMLPRTALHLLGEVSFRKVTVAKEVIRLLGEIRHDAAYERLVALSTTDLHRDVRIALLRALWDHLDRAPTWTVFEHAVSGPDWVMASRLGDIPADRLTRETDRLLSALLARVLARPEPEARIDLLRRAAMLAVSDPERTFLAACAARLASVYDDEVRAAMNAMLHRATEVDMTRLPTLLTEALADPRCLHVAVATLLSVPIQQRAVWVGAARAAEQVLATDPRWLPLRIRCAAAALPGHAFGEYLRRLGEDTPLGHDAVHTCLAAVDAIALEQLADLIDRLSASTCPEVRRVAVAALVRDAGPGRGWAPERLHKLAALQADPSPLVSGAALAVFPPRELAEPERRRRPATPEKP